LILDDILFELVEILQKEEGAVRTQISRARNRLKEELNKIYG